MTSKLWIVFTSLLVVAADGLAQDRKADVGSYPVGGVSIKIPVPHRDLVNVPAKDSALVKVFVAPQNLLVAAFVKPKDLELIRARDDSLEMDHYAMVQISRRVEKTDISRAQFRQLGDLMKNQFGEIMSKSAAEATKQLNERLKELEVDGQVDLGKPTPLGGFFSQPEAYGFGMIMPVQVDGQDLGRMAMGGAIVRLKNRLLNFYLYREYKNSQTIVTLRKETETWVNAALKANR